MARTTPLNPTNAPKVVTLDRKQAVLDSIRMKFGGPGTVQTPGYLRLEVRLGANTQTIRFNVIQDSQNQYDTENRLDRNDSFTVTDWGFYLGQKAVVAGDSQIGVDNLQTGPNPASIATGLTTAIFDAIHGGRLRFVADSTVFLDSLDLLRTRMVGIAQAGLDPGGGTDYAASQWNEETGMAPMLPSITFSGAMKLELSVELPRSVAYATSATQNLHAVLIFRGFLNQGGAQFRPE
jgi:hypothetical protein